MSSKRRGSETLGPGSHVGRYRIDALLGAGGMGEVFAGYDTKLLRRVAIKVLHTRMADSSDAGAATARILREARAAAALDHPGAVRVLDVGEDDGIAFMVMELVEGTVLRVAMGEPSHGAEARVRWLTEIATTLAHAHRAGLVHRDIKPENVMIAHDGAAKVLDFGIAKRAESAGVEAAADTGVAALLTQPNVVMGTPTYMAPEQLRGDPTDARCDQFAWGIVAFEVLTGHLPWDLQRGIVPYISSVISEDAPPLDASRATVTETVAGVVARSLKRAPGERFETMAALVQALAERASPGTTQPPFAEAPTARVTTMPPPRPEWLAEGLSGVSAPPPASRISVEPPGSAPPPHHFAYEPTQSVVPLKMGSMRKAAVTASSGTGHLASEGGNRRRWVIFGVAAGLIAAVAIGALRLRAEGLGNEGRRRDGPPASIAVAPLSTGTSILDLHRPAFSSTVAEEAYLDGLRSARDGDRPSAIARFRAAVAEDPGLAAGHFRLGTALMVPDTRSARDAFAQAARLRDRMTPRDAAVLDALRPWYAVPSDPAAAAARLASLELRFPGDAELLALEGTALNAVGRQVDAVPVLERSLVADPQFAYAANQLMGALAFLGDLEGALRQAKSCVERSASAHGCWARWAVLHHDAGDRASCEAVTRAASGALPRSAGVARWRADATSSGASLAATKKAVEAWLSLEDPSAALDLTIRAQIAIRVLSGDLRVTIPDVTNPQAIESRGKWIGNGAEATDLFVLEETARLKDLERLARVLLDEHAFDLGSTMSASALLSDPRPEIWRALRISGAWSRQDVDVAREKAAAEWSPAPYLEPITWVRLWAALVVDDEDARRALEKVPAGGPPRFLYGWAHHLDIGRTYLLAGRAELALPWLRRAAGSCRALASPVTFVRAQHWLGRGLEASGDRPGACRAYAEVLGRWRGKSVTADATRARAKALNCTP